MLTQLTLVTTYSHTTTTDFHRYGVTHTTTTTRPHSHEHGIHTDNKTQQPLHTQTTPDTHIHHQPFAQAATIQHHARQQTCTTNIWTQDQPLTHRHTDTEQPVLINKHTHMLRRQRPSKPTEQRVSFSFPSALPSTLPHHASRKPRELNPRCDEQSSVSPKAEHVCAPLSKHGHLPHVPTLCG